MTLDPLGFGEGYEDGSYGTNKRLDPFMMKDALNIRNQSSSASISFGTTPEEYQEPVEVMAAQPAVPAIASFTYDIYSGRRLDLADSSLNAVRYEWDFGRYPDGSSVGQSTQKYPTVFYRDIGGARTYTVTLTAYNKDGVGSTSIQNIFIESADPVCDFTYVVKGTKVSFTNTSTCPFGVLPIWSFGDLDTTWDINPIHDYRSSGSFKARLTMGTYSKEYTIVIDAEVVLSCDASAGATGYIWERSPDGVTDWDQFADTVSTTLSVTKAGHGIDSTVLNFFRVKAYNTSGDSDLSDVINVACS
ncbi:PKD domain-containing protein [Candidatus Pacearchaeota archaeon]|nr:PKD domain-containing protein [Candidatus Pacearchaeota archaeon]